MRGVVGQAWEVIVEVTVAKTRDENKTKHTMREEE